MILAVASGKGGTGKTTVAVNLARVMGTPVRLLDCDVEEPNAHLFLGGETRSRDIVSLPVPVVDESLCDACGECGRFCEFHAIVSLATKPLVFAELCHGCGGCLRVCPRGAIAERERRIGVVETIESNGITVIRGLLDVGVAMAPPLVRAVKARLAPGVPAIVDAPPGTSCPVIAAVRGADFVALVTEPTPFGLNDLALAVDMVRELDLPLGVVINRIGVGDERVHAFCREKGIPILLEIPDDRRIAEVYSRGGIVVDALPEYRAHFERLRDRVEGGGRPS
jgi:MinD superfamily P-loop ATPase